jgi:hypothetical protein
VFTDVAGFSDPMRNDSDRDVVRAAQAGCAEAFNRHGNPEACGTQTDLTAKIELNRHLWCQKSSSRPLDSAAFFFCVPSMFDS